MKPRVLIVDDHAEFRSAARLLLQAQGFDVIADAPDGVSAIEAVHQLRPDVVLLDINLPGKDGFEVAEELRAVVDPPIVVLISSRDASAYGPRLARTSARGFLPKSALSGDALSALIA